MSARSPRPMSVTSALDNEGALSPRPMSKTFVDHGPTDGRTDGPTDITIRRDAPLSL